MLVAGATGYLGRRLVTRLLASGRAVRALVRGGAKRARRLPHLMDAEIVPGDLDDPAALARAMRDVDTVFHVVGIIRERGAATFEAVHVAGTRALVEAAQAAGVKRFAYVSAIGARPDAPTAYWRTKAAAEEIVRGSGLSWLILRPSIVFARDGEIHGILRQLTLFPLVPVLGPGTSRLAPVRADDLADLEVRALDRPEVWGRVHEISGPEAYTFDELLRAAARGRPVLLVHVPLALARPLVSALSVLPFAPITPDQFAMLQEDSVADAALAGRAFGITLRGIGPILAGKEDAA